MEFKPKEKTRKYYIKRAVIGVVIVLLAVIAFVEVYSPIYINNFEDLDVSAEADRVGGDFYEKDGDKMYFVDYKKDDNRDTILYIHGFGGSTFSWRNNISSFLPQYRVVTVDLMGFGMSKTIKSQDIGLDRDVDILNSFIKDKKLQNITVVGHSMGGLVAQKLAFDNPKDVISLVLINSIDQSSQDQGISFSGLLKPFVDLAPIKYPLGAFSYSSIQSSLKSAYYNDNAVDKMTYEGYQKGFRYKGSLDAQIKFLKSSKMKEFDLSKIKQLTLIYSADNDDIIKPEIQERLSKNIINSQLLKIPKSGHLIMEEQPLLINEGISKWIEDAKSKLNVG